LHWGREELTGFGIVYISARFAAIHRRRHTGSWRRVTESGESNQFAHLYQTIRDGLQPDFAALVEALEDRLDIDPDRRFAVLMKINGTVKDICNYFREKAVALPGSTVRYGGLTSRSKRVRLESLTTGQLNCLVTAADKADLLNTSEITVDVLFNCRETSGLAEQSTVAL
jgi:hypothetical protein